MQKLPQILTHDISKTINCGGKVIRTKIMYYVMIYLFYSNTFSSKCSPTSLELNSSIFPQFSLEKTLFWAKYQCFEMVPSRFVFSGVEIGENRPGTKSLTKCRQKFLTAITRPVYRTWLDKRTVGLTVVEKRHTLTKPL